jgi:N-methylhydantoinase A/oxoprolinase/acetone carboxylase beta subunit
MAVRIGIDVGGTFTDAVAIDNDTYELIGAVKVPTTHSAEEGVAVGIIEALRKLMSDCGISAGSVTFIAHGTTQATNALLEGDVSPVGIITLGNGIEGFKAKNDTNIGNIELAKGKFLRTSNVFVNNADKSTVEENVRRAIEELKGNGADSIVATEAFGVDNPENENQVVALCAGKGIPSTAGNDVSKLYGLKVRTRTAVINASIMPKMLEAANMTERSIKYADIEAPLMVMRCDGGVMTVDEVRSRPILTILSGPAAGVAGALMYERLTDGIFLEVGGTSTDISCVRDGNVMIKYAEVGGHKTYLNSLDVRTVGIGGGSMVEISNGQIVDVGPRSAHIAGMDYEIYADESMIVNPILKGVHPIAGDPEYAYVECSNGAKFALTLSGAANIAGFVAKGNYAEGNVAAAVNAWKPLAGSMGLSVEETAGKVLGFSAVKNGRIVRSLIEDYELNEDSIVMVGGGGGASTVVPHLAKVFRCKHKIAENAHVISPIGVSLAMVREMVERIVLKPSEDDILSIRNEGLKRAIQSGASPETVEVEVTVDTSTNRLRAVAIGTTELRTKDLNEHEKNIDDLKSIVAESLRASVADVSLEAESANYCAFSMTVTTKKFGIFKRKTHPIRIIDRMGVIRLQRANATIHKCKVKNRKKLLKYLLDEYIMTSEGGEEIPNIYVACGKRIINLSGMQKAEQMFALCDVELAMADENDDVIMICTLARENDRG